MSKYLAYSDYKELGIDWLERIPTHWITTPVKIIAKIYNGATPKSDETSYWDGNIPWITPADIGKSNSPYIHKGKRNITLQGYDSCGTSIVPDKSVILSSRAPIGTLGISERQLCTNQGCKSLVVQSNFNYKYLYYMLLISNTQLNLLGRGTTFLELSSDELGAYVIPSPSKNEQINIANFLDHETAKIDTLIEKQQQLIKLLKEKRQAVISHAVTKGLNPDAPMKDSGVKWLGEVPEHWKIMKMAYLSERICVGFVGTIEKFYTDENGVPLLKTGNISFRGIDLTDLSYVSSEFDKANSKSHVVPGDIVIARHGESGRSAVIPENINCANCLNIVVLRVAEVMNGQFYSELLNSPQCQQNLKALQGGSVQGVINTSDISNLLVPFPPKEEQDECIHQALEQARKVDQLIAKSEKAVSLLKERRTALISAAVTGKIDVRHWQPATPDSAFSEVEHSTAFIHSHTGQGGH